MIKPFVNLIISIGKLKQMKPTTARNCDEINTIVFGYLSTNTHGLNLTIVFHSRRVPETGDSAETNDEFAQSP
jgi:hypothetical protein